MIKIKQLAPILLILSLVLMTTFFAGCIWWWNDEEDLSPVEYVTVEYITVGSDFVNGSFSGNPSTFGSIIGDSRQVFVKGENATTVTVVPNIGYKFIKWTDTGSSNPTRTDYNVQQSQTFYAIMEGPLTFVMEFKSGVGGTVEGELSQLVVYGATSKPVTAIPDEGYRFVQWSDGDKNATRINENVLSQYFNEEGWPYITAEFERYERKFQYIYNDATSNNDETEISINLDNLNRFHLPIPQRDGYIFEGWYSDWHHTVQVADKNGVMLVGKEWLDNNYIYDEVNPEGYLYAKWKANIEVPTFKILMPYVTEIHATTETRYYGTISVDYVMSDIEREVCEAITQRFACYLNAILNGRVNFIVESYFTTKTLTSENLNRTTGTHPFTGSKLWDNYMLKNVEEIDQKRNEYDAILTTFSLNDNEHKLHVSAGSAGGKNAQIHFENLTHYFYDRDSRSLTDLFDLSIDGMYKIWDSVIETYLHEFIHILENRFVIMDDVGLHEALKTVRGGNTYEVIIPFLRGEFILNGQQTGVKYQYWLEK